jgi:hypothetical protein
LTLPFSKQTGDNGRALLQTNLDEYEGRSVRNVPWIIQVILAVITILSGPPYTALQYHYFLNIIPEHIMHLSYLGTSLKKIQSRQKSFSCIHNHSETAISTSSYRNIGGLTSVTASADPASLSRGVTFSMTQQLPHSSHRPQGLVPLLTDHFWAIHPTLWVAEGTLGMSPISKYEEEGMADREWLRSNLQSCQDRINMIMLQNNDT